MEINKIYCGDCLEIMKTFSDNSIDYIITSPPYNINKEKYINYKDNLKDYYGFLVDRLKEMLRITKKYIFFNIMIYDTNKIEIIELLYKFRYNLKDIIIWKKNKFGLSGITKGRLLREFEFIFVFENRCLNRTFNPCYFNNNYSNVIDIKYNSKYNEFHKKHKATFPKELIREILKNFTKKGDIILDPFCGTGTTCLVAKEMQRNYIGIDINKDYDDLTETRLNKTNTLINYM